MKADTFSLDRIVKGHEHGSILWLRLLFHQRGRNNGIYRESGGRSDGAVVLMGLEGLGAAIRGGLEMAGGFMWREKEKKLEENFRD